MELRLPIRVFGVRCRADRTRVCRGGKEDIRPADQITAMGSRRKLAAYLACVVGLTGPGFVAAERKISDRPIRLPLWGRGENLPRFFDDLPVPGLVVPTDPIPEHPLRRRPGPALELQ